MTRESAICLYEALLWSEMEGGPDEVRLERGVKLILSATTPTMSIEVLELQKAQLEEEEAYQECRRMISAPEGTFAQEDIERKRLRWREAAINVAEAKVKAGVK